MRCDEIEGLVQQRLDARQPLESDRVLRRHAEACPHCHALLVAYDDLWTGLELSAPAPLDQGFTERVIAQLQPTRPVSADGRWSSWMALALAASLLITVSLVWRHLASGVGEAPGPAVPGGPSRLATEAPLPSEPASTPARPRAGDPPLFALSQAPFGNLLGPWTERLAQQPLVVVDGLADGFRPVRESLGTALDVLRTAFPLKLKGDAERSSGDSAFSPSAGAQPA